jgi:hypothetical protein
MEKISTFFCQKCVQMGVYPKHPYHTWSHVYSEVSLTSIKSQLSLGPLVVEKVADSQYRYNTDTDLANLNLGIGYPMQSVIDSKVSIEPLDIDWHKIFTR